MIPTRSDLYIELRRRHPAWMFAGLRRYALQVPSPVFGEGSTYGDFLYAEPTIESDDPVPMDPVYGPYCTQFAQFYEWFLHVWRQTFIEHAEGNFLDLHARDRGRPRRPGETDRFLRRRIRRVPDAVTENAIQIAVDQALQRRHPHIGDPAPSRVMVWGRGFFRRQYWTRYPDHSADTSEVYTLRYRQLAWGRHAWGRAKQWAVTVLPQRPRGAMYWGLSPWRARRWESFGLVKFQRQENPFAVSVVVVPRQTIRVHNFWRGFHFRRSHWGGTQPDLNTYKAIRQAVEETRAAGITVEIQIKEP